jgi:hypothetical protein
MKSIKSNIDGFVKGTSAAATRPSACVIHLD